MARHLFSVPGAVGFALLLLASFGCSRPAPPPTAESLADAKVEAIKRLADAMAKEPNGPEAAGALEDFRNAPLDPRKNPKQAEEVLAVYRQRIQGKYKGFVVQELQGEIAALQPRPGQK
jgi:hypothetical protein